MKVLIINGPNLNLTGKRETDVYGTESYEAMMGYIKEKAEALGIDTEIRQTNHEGAIIDMIQEAGFDGTDGIVINAGAYTHYSYAIRDALSSVSRPVKVEVHLSDIYSRESFRHLSVITEVCDKTITGLGREGYIEALRFVQNRCK